MNIAQKEDNLWVMWVNHLYIKEEDWWDYEVPQDNSWYWKKICHIKYKMARGYVNNHKISQGGKYTIRNGYKWLSGSQVLRQHQTWVWNSLNIPKHMLANHAW